MNMTLSDGLRMLACGVAAVAITLALSLVFVRSTEVVRNEVDLPAPWTAKLTLVHPHAWLGQPWPAVLVD